LVVLDIVAYNADWDEHWINADKDLVSFITLVDGGVGGDNTTKAALYRGSATSCGAVVINADLAETNTSSAVDGHRICGYGMDLLGNEPQNAPVSNWFGKDTEAPDVYILAGSPAADLLTACADPGLNAALNHDDNLFNIAGPFPAEPVAGVPAGFGVEAIDDRAGFHKDDAAG
jgi:hypothetical protein